MNYSNNFIFIFDKIIFNKWAVLLKSILLFSDVDECEAIPGICENGKCVNSMGSFRCDCDKGYLYNEDASACEGKIPNTFLLFLVNYNTLKSYSNVLQCQFFV